MIQRIDLRLSNLEDGTVPFADISIDTQGDALVITDADGVQRFGVYYADGALRVVAWSDFGEVVNELESRKSER